MGVYNLLVALVGVRLAMRVAAVLSLATIYTACVIYFSTMVVPWLEGLFASAYGQLLGLLLGQLGQAASLQQRLGIGLGHQGGFALL